MSSNQKEYAKIEIAAGEYGTAPMANGRLVHTVRIWNPAIINLHRHNLIKGSRVMVDLDR